VATAKARDVDAYIVGANPDARPHLEAVRKVILATIPGVEEGISYGVPFYKYHGQLAGFAVYKNHVSFGVSAGGLQPGDREALERKGYKTGTRTVQIGSTRTSRPRRSGEFSERKPGSIGPRCADVSSVHVIVTSASLARGAPVWEVRLP